MGTQELGVVGVFQIIEQVEYTHEGLYDAMIERDRKLSNRLSNFIEFVHFGFCWFFEA